MPPGSAKSTYASQIFPSWFLAQNPSQRILLCSHSYDLAESFGRFTRNTVDQQPQYLGYALSDDSKAAGVWNTDKQGGFFCAGVGGRIAGRRADLALIDDPLGSAEDAQSKDIRDKQWTWWLRDVKPRLKPNASIGLIQTRWHEDDLAGRILAKEKDWTVIRIPMVAEENDPLGRQPGERLWSDYFTEEMVLEAMEDAETWDALYQQNPTSATGDFFKAENLQMYEVKDLPHEDELRIYAASDHAVSTRESADFTCMGAVGVDAKSNIWILPDLFWDKVKTDVCVEQMLALAKRRKPLMWAIESQHIEKAIGPFLKLRMQETNTYFAIEEFSSGKDKRTKAQSIQGRIATNKVFFPNTSWWKNARHELLSFDSGKHDDFVDFLSLIGRMLGRLTKPGLSKSTKEPAKVLSARWLKESCSKKERDLEGMKGDW